MCIRDRSTPTNANAIRTDARSQDDHPDTGSTAGQPSNDDAGIDDAGLRVHSAGLVPVSYTHLVLMPALERAFDALDSGDEVVHLSRLSLKLKVRSLEQLAAELPALITEQLDEALGGAAAQTASATRRRPAALQRMINLLHYLHLSLIHI